MLIFSNRMVRKDLAEVMSWERSQQIDCIWLAWVSVLTYDLVLMFLSTSDQWGSGLGASTRWYKVCRVKQYIGTSMRE